MIRIAHLSDLHFGRTRPELVEPLLAAVAALRPDLVAVSGDLTQRARPGQFAAGTALLRRIAAPVLIVPGNHDIPLFNLPLRLAAPFARWRRWVAADLSPVVALPGLVALGMNTADPFAHERGRVRGPELARVLARLAQAGPSRLRVIVLHHPLDHPPGVAKEPVAGGADAARALTAAGADLVLAGHLHVWGAAPFVERAGGRASIFIQAGTGLSTRLREEENDFNLIEHRPGAGPGSGPEARPDSRPEPGRLEVIRYRALPDGSAFVAAARSAFVKGQAGWTRSG